ncbi:hypothetical protein HW555_000188 [Spodoptera exigua]|uniref:Uncharacterized protein n=1 Tax=Spodoptera exigua TaxID=7107 RepID=A0A835GVL5_SPOEX|nr:hypothetical protein HW555_000188 [Spodoptera exigua]
MIKANIRAAKRNAIMKSASDLVIVPKKRKQKSLPAIKLHQDKQNKKLNKNENTITIHHGIVLNKMCDMQKEEIGKKSSSKKDKKMKKNNKKHVSNPSSTYTQERVKKVPRNEDKHNSGQKQSAGKTISKQKGSEMKQNKVHIKSVEAPINKRHLDKNKNYEKLNKQSNYRNHSPSSDSKKYILSLIKKCNNDNEDIKKKSPSRTTQTSTGSLSSNKSSKSKNTKTIKDRLRKQIWHWAKNSMKRSENWTKFLADNNITLDDISIDKLDHTLIDVDTLGIENKLLKRTVLWLFK